MEQDQDESWEDLRKGYARTESIEGWIWFAISMVFVAVLALLAS